MIRQTFSLGLAAALIALAGCSEQNGAADGNGAGATAQTGEAKDAAGGNTIAQGINQNGKFFQALKASGLDSTFAGPGPYTVLAPDDAAFAKLPAGAVDNLLKPESRAQLTGVLTNHVFSGTVLAEDIGKAIDAGKGKAMMATMGGGMLTATRESGKIVLTDGNGAKAIVTKADEQHSNGVVHHIDTVLMPPPKT